MLDNDWLFQIVQRHWCECYTARLWQLYVSTFTETLRETNEVTIFHALSSIVIVVNINVCGTQTFVCYVKCINRWPECILHTTIGTSPFIIRSSPPAATATTTTPLQSHLFCQHVDRETETDNKYPSTADFSYSLSSFCVMCNYAHHENIIVVLA